MLKNSFNFKLRSRSKSREKEAKYIPAAIIPSVAFVANPSLPTHGNSESNSNKLLTSTLNSSLVGLSAEFRKHQVDKTEDLDEDDERMQSFERRSFGSGVDTHESSEKSNDKKHKRKKIKVKPDSINNSKRHISIAHGLSETKSPTPKSRPFKHTVDDIMIHNVDNSFLLGTSPNQNNNFGIKSPNISNFPSQKLDLEYSENDDIRDIENSIIIDKDGQQKNLSNKRIENNVTSLGFDLYPKDLLFEQDKDIHIYETATGDKSVEMLLTTPSLYKDEAYDVIYSVPNYFQKHMQKQGDDRSVRQLKDEIRVLQDTVYRLSVEIGHLLPEQEPGRSIGKSIFPGKGPAPSWIMNTKYLTPLLAAYDLKFQRQNIKIESMREGILKFEKEIRFVINENEELHSKLQMNAKNGFSNQREWHIIAKQTKLVIEENQLLLQELDVQQKRTQELERKYIMEIQELRNALPKVINQPEHEITSNIEEVKGSTCETSPSHSSKKDSFLNEIHILQSKIEDLLKNKGSLETEIEYLRSSDKKMKKKIEKLKSALQSEKEFHKYLGDVIDKSNDIVNERNRVMEMLEQRDSEIKRVSHKLRNQMKYNLDLGIDENVNKIIPGGKINDVSMEELHNLECWMIMLLQTIEDLNNRCRHQEKDVHYYQSLLKEKDKSLQECEMENEELELKLDLVWKNATKDSII